MDRDTFQLVVVMMLIIIAFLIFNLTFWESMFHTAHGEKCYDIKYEENGLKMPGKNHDDNTPSESKFKNKIFKEDATLCEVAKCYDNHDCKGELDKKDRNKFEDSIVYMGSSEEQQKCLDHRYDLPDDGQEALQSYEIYDCAVDKY